MGSLYLFENMENEDGKIVDLYTPRKCVATNRVIVAKDHASVQLNIGHLDANGVYQGDYTPMAMSGYVRFNAGSDQAMNRFAAEKGLMKDLAKFPDQHKFKGEE